MGTVKTIQELSILIAGCGSIGKRHARVFCEELALTDVRACDPIEGQRRALKEHVPSVKMHDSFEEGLAGRPNIVLIGTPPEMHVAMAAEAIRAGCHVLCEKPLSDTTDGIDDLATLAAEHRRKVMVAHCMRYHDGIVRARRLLAEDRIGRLAAIRALVGEHLPDARPDYKSSHMANVNGAFDLSHEVDLAVWFAGRPVKNVHCVHGNFSDIGIKAPDLAQILIEFEDRCVASIHLDFFQQPRRRLLELIGTRGVITVEFARWDQCTVMHYSAGEAAGSEAGATSWQKATLDMQRDDMFVAEDRAFLEAVASDGPVPCDIADAKRSVEVIQKAVASGKRATETSIDSANDDLNTHTV